MAAAQNSDGSDNDKSGGKEVFHGLAILIYRTILASLLRPGVENLLSAC
ncbi:MAG: hypothetical protein WCS94_01960 [Verrucomicrobiota bacterium]